MPSDPTAIAAPPRAGSPDQPVASPATPAANAGPLQAGAKVQEFEILSTVGQGGFGIVYLARDLALQRLVAIKEYMPVQLAVRGRDGRVRAINPGQSDLFERGLRSFVNEARMLARFTRPGLVEVLRFWEQNGTAYMAMRYYDGATLTDYVKRHPGVVTESWLKSILKPVIEALAAMHAEDCFHRDVSPDNILILKEGGAVLLDLGAARHVIAGDMQAMTVMLKPGFAPIEQYADDPRLRQGPWTDVYAFAAVLYFCTTGKPPPASAARVIRDGAQALADGAVGSFSAPFLRAIDRGLALRPEERPRSMLEFSNLLQDSSGAEALPMRSPKPQRDDHPTAIVPDAAAAAEGAAARLTPASVPAGTESGRPGPLADAIRTSVPTRIDAGELAPPARADLRGLANGSAVHGARWHTRVAVGSVVAVALAVVGAVAIRTAADSASPPIVQSAADIPAAEDGGASRSNAAGPAALPSEGMDGVAAGDPGAAGSQGPDIGHPEVGEAPAVDSGGGLRRDAAPGDDVPGHEARGDGVPVDARRVDAGRGDAVPAARPAPATSIAGGAQRTASAPAAPGHLYIAVYPWGEVRVNGVLRGVSPPLKSVALPPGRYSVELRNPAGKPVRRTVEVTAGGKASITHRF